MTSPSLDRTIAHLLRDLAPQVLGGVVRRHDDFAGAEDAVQEALIAAAAQWPADGIPDNPRGWLYHVALRRLSDHLRSEATRRRREDLVAKERFTEELLGRPVEVDLGADHDDTLLLLFMCCHPALTSSTAIALTLRAVGGLTTAEIASAFLVPEATMAQRISRAKQTIKASKVPFSMPSEQERAERLSAVLHVLYLIFNEGYVSTAGADLSRPDLSNEAIRLTRVVHALDPKDGEVGALLALMVLTDARRSARVGPAGELIPLDEQDRAAWDQRLISEGCALVSDALSRGAIGPYQIQAAIAAVHSEGASASSTDWPQIKALYSLLMGISDNPMVALNHAIAVAMVDGSAAGLALVDELELVPRMRGHHRLAAVRAHLLSMAGDRDGAIRWFHVAAASTASVPERNYLLGKISRLAARD